MTIKNQRVEEGQARGLRGRHPLHVPGRHAVPAAHQGARAVEVCREAMGRGQGAELLKAPSPEQRADEERHHKEVPDAARLRPALHREHALANRLKASTIDCDREDLYDPLVPAARGQAARRDRRRRRAAPEGDGSRTAIERPSTTSSRILGQTAQGRASSGRSSLPCRAPYRLLRMSSPLAEVLRLRRLQAPPEVARSVDARRTSWCCSGWRRGSTSRRDAWAAVGGRGLHAAPHSGAAADVAARHRHAEERSRAHRAHDRGAHRCPSAAPGERARALGLHDPGRWASILPDAAQVAPSPLSKGRGEGPRRRGARAATHLLQPPGDARGARQGNPGARRAHPPQHDAALHAPVAARAGGGNRAAQSAPRGRGSWRNPGDGELRPRFSRGIAAEREGFEPSVPLRVHMISNHAPSATRSSLQSSRGRARRPGRGTPLSTVP